VERGGRHATKNYGSQKKTLNSPDKSHRDILVEVGFGQMNRKRGGWLSALFLGEMLTATAMGFFEDEIAKAVVLALFVPLIISGGGNSGSQSRHTHCPFARTWRVAVT
jgi:Mg/Co/Ni transporter MgtE